MNECSNLAYVHICGFYLNVQKIIQDLSPGLGSCSVFSSDPDVGLRALESPGTWNKGLIYVGKLVSLQPLRFILKFESIGSFHTYVMTKTGHPRPLILPCASRVMGYKPVSYNLNSVFWNSGFYESRHWKLSSSFRQNAHSPVPTVHPDQLNHLCNRLSSYKLGMCYRPSHSMTDDIIFSVDAFKISSSSLVFRSLIMMYRNMVFLWVYTIGDFWSFLNLKMYVFKKLGQVLALIAFFPQLCQYHLFKKFPFSIKLYRRPGWKSIHHKCEALLLDFQWYPIDLPVRPHAVPHCLDYCSIIYCSFSFLFVIYLDSS